MVNVGCVMSAIDQVVPAAGAEMMTNDVRVRVFFPYEAWVRFQKMGKRLALEEKTLVRVLASLQLAQLESMYERSAGMEQATEADLNQRGEELLGDLPGVKKQAA